MRCWGSAFVNLGFKVLGVKKENSSSLALVIWPTLALLSDFLMVMIVSFTVTVAWIALNDRECHAELAVR